MSHDTENNFMRDMPKRLATSFGLAKLSPETAQAIFDKAPKDLPPIPKHRIDDIVRRATDSSSSATVQSDEGHWESVAPANIEEDNVVLNRNPVGPSASASSMLDNLRCEALGIQPVPKSKLDAQSERNLIERAAEQAEELINSLRIREAPVDPFQIAATEAAQLIVKAGDFGDLFDGQLEFHSSHNKFLLFLNSKYDAFSVTESHPRTRFSLAHELGHYFLEDHHRYLRTGGKIHRSRGEFFNEQQREREADAFAAALLMPRQLFEEHVNQGEPNANMICELADKFKTSILSSALRAIQLSHFPCALASIRDGNLAWTRCSESLIESGCYPMERGAVRCPDAVSAWNRFDQGQHCYSRSEGLVRDWFRTYSRSHLQQLPVTQYFIGIPSMRTLVVLLTIEERDLYEEDDE